MIIYAKCFIILLKFNVFVWEFLNRKSWVFYRRYCSYFRSHLVSAKIMLAKYELCQRADWVLEIKQPTLRPGVIGELRSFNG